jgi:hypothetical protein
LSLLLGSVLVCSGSGCFERTVILVEPAKPINGGCLWLIYGGLLPLARANARAIHALWRRRWRIDFWGDVAGGVAREPRFGRSRRFFIVLVLVVVLDCFPRRADRGRRRPRARARKIPPLLYRPRPRRRARLPSSPGRPRTMTTTSTIRKMIGTSGHHAKQIRPFGFEARQFLHSALLHHPTDDDDENETLNRYPHPEFRSSPCCFRPGA